MSTRGIERGRERSLANTKIHLTLGNKRKTLRKCDSKLSRENITALY